MTTGLLFGAVLLLGSAPVMAQEARGPILARATLEVTELSEVVATLTAECERCDWAVKGREAVLLEVRVDDKYSQHVALVRGSHASDYRILLGRMAPGRHAVTISRDERRSAAHAGAATIDRLALSTVAPSAPDFDSTSRAPFLRARPGTVERFSDFPLVMYAERHAGSEGPAPYDLQYTVIFSNEDGGTPSDRLMATWGRTTDIEFVFGVTAVRGTQPPREIIQTEGHRWVDFNGSRSAGHPELWVATDNNMVADHGADDLIRFAPAPMLVALNGVSREKVMDDAEWTYQTTSAEMLREERVVSSGLDGTGRMADPRRYAVVEACGELVDATLEFEVGVRTAAGDLTWHSSDLGLSAFRIARSGCFRAGALVPDGVSLPDLDAVRVRVLRHPSAPLDGQPGRVVLTRVNQVLMLDRDFRPVHINIDWNGSVRIPVDSEGFAVPLVQRR